MAAVTLSWGGPGQIPHRYEIGKRQLEAEFGLKVVEMAHTLSPPDYIYQNPQARADDLMAAFADPEIKAVVSTIGGDDSIRILPYLDLDLIRRNPKIFLGYSDTTITHFACYKAGLTTFYGPSIMAGFAENGGMFPYMVDSVRRSLFSTEPIGEVMPNRDGWTVEHLDWAIPALQTQKRRLNRSTGWRWLQGRGVREGPLLGGCVEVLDWLRGTSFWPSIDAAWDGAILFLEASEDMPTPTDLKYWLRTYATLGILERLNGILYARPGGQIAVERFEAYDRVLLDVVRGEAGLADLPIVTHLDFGHTDPMFLLPYGVRARLDCVKKRFFIIESGVGTTTE